jgi:ATP-dependent Clp protease adaptor protein ClpS
VAKSGISGSVKTTEKRETRLSPPAMYQVLMHNDDYTTMDFVVEVLEKVFRKTVTEANQVMLNIHHKGHGVCGLYPYEVAETKISQVHSLARKTGFPLRCSLEKV